MYNDQALQPGRENQSSPDLPHSLSTATESFLSAKTTYFTTHLGNSTLIAVPLSLLALWTIALVCFNRQQKRQNYGTSTTVGHKQFHGVPCRRCVFFKNNPYLKCAINPLNALTVSAIDCPDYTPPITNKR